MVFAEFRFEHFSSKKILEPYCFVRGLIVQTFLFDCVAEECRVKHGMTNNSQTTHFRLPILRDTWSFIFITPESWKTDEEKRENKATSSSSSHCRRSTPKKKERVVVRKFEGSPAVKCDKMHTHRIWMTFPTHQAAVLASRRENTSEPDSASILFSN